MAKEAAVAEGFVLGAGIEGWCTKCREMQLHHIVSLNKEEKPARVRCKVCDGEHNHRPSPPQSRRSSAGKKAAPRKKVGLSLTEEQKAAAVPYQIGGTFKRGDVISHPTFGFGEVTEIRSTQRMLVLFDTSQKLLIYDTELPS